MRNTSYQPPWNYAYEYGGTGFRMTRMVKLLLWANFIVMLAQLILDRSPHPGYPQIPGMLSQYFGLRGEYIGRGWLWQFFTYMFLHAYFLSFPLHFLMNMLCLFLLGPETERGMGSRHFLIMYLLSGVLGGIMHLLVSGPRVLCVGASGSIFGIIGAFAAMYPQRQITLFLFFVFPISIRAWVLAAILGLIQFLFLVGGAGGNVAYSVHVGGLISGCIYALIVFRPEVLANLFNRRPRMPRRPGRHLRIMKPPTEDFTTSSQEIDHILDKIAEQGMSSLTPLERAKLEKASRERNTKG